MLLLLLPRCRKNAHGHRQSTPSTSNAHRESQKKRKISGRATYEDKHAAARLGGWRAAAFEAVCTALSRIDPGPGFETVERRCEAAGGTVHYAVLHTYSAIAIHARVGIRLQGRGEHQEAFISHRQLGRVAPARQRAPVSPSGSTSPHRARSRRLPRSPTALHRASP